MFIWLHVICFHNAVYSLYHFMFEENIILFDEFDAKNVIFLYCRSREWLFLLASRINISFFFFFLIYL